MDDHQNPFASPLTSSEDLEADSPGGLPPLAGRLTRLLAKIVDNLVMGIAGLPITYFMYRDMFSIAIDPSLSPLERQQAIASAQPTLTTIALSFLSGIALYLLVNGYWLTRDGQTVGKKAVGVKMVRSDGSQATLGRLFGARELPFWLLPMIPLLGGLVVLVDILLIFRGSRQCLHDQVADTVVVQANG